MRGLYLLYNALVFRRLRSQGHGGSGDDDDGDNGLDGVF